LNTAFVSTPNTRVTESPLGDDEAPNNIVFGGDITYQMRAGYTVDTTWTRTFTRNGAAIAGFPTQSGSDVGSSTNPQLFANVTVPVGTAQPGDTFCTQINVAPGAGRLYSDGSRVITDSFNTDRSCITLVGRPYFKVFGDDVAVGGGSAACTSTAGQIAAFARRPDGVLGYNRGASAQYAIQALEQIEGFYSASTHTAYPAPLKGLTFANNDAAVFGGEFGQQYCGTDWFDASSRRGTAANITGTAFNLATMNGAIADRHFTYTDPDNTTSAYDLIVHSTAPITSSHAVYVDGDVFINSNIDYADTFTLDPAAPGLVTTKPYIALIVRGNIYIGPGVTQLDGLYVAQQFGSRADSGRIYTCAPLGAKPTDTATGATFPQCRNKLTVTGAMYARSVKLARSNGSQNKAVNGEGMGSANLAEEFVFRPDMYIGDLPFRTIPGTQSGSGYSFITSLPPIF
jgi:hypothetical protein